MLNTLNTLSSFEKENIKNGILTNFSANDWLVLLALSAFSEDQIASVNLATLIDITGLDAEDIEFSFFKLNTKGIITALTKDNKSWVLDNIFKFNF